MVQFDKDQVSQLVDNLIQGEQDLTDKRKAAVDVSKQSAQAIADTQARLDAARQKATDDNAKATNDLSAAEATNKANVNAIKQYFDSLDDEGNEPDAPPTDPNAGTGGTAGTTTSDTGTTADGGTTEAGANPASNPNATTEDDNLKPRGPTA